MAASPRARPTFSSPTRRRPRRDAPRFSLSFRCSFGGTERDLSARRDPWPRAARRAERGGRRGGNPKITPSSLVSSLQVNAVYARALREPLYVAAGEPNMRSSDWRVFTRKELQKLGVRTADAQL